MNKKEIMKKYLKTKSDGKGGIGPMSQMSMTTPMAAIKKFRKIANKGMRNSEVVSPSSIRPKQPPYSETPETKMQKNTIMSAYKKKYGDWEKK